jgi:hypothetical protein
MWGFLEMMMQAQELVWTLSMLVILALSILYGAVLLSFPPRSEGSEEFSRE